MKMNLPNKLTVLRLLMVPVFVVILMITDALWATVLGLVLFVLASFTDMLDGKIARKRGLVTDFGKFLDPLADKFMVIGAMMVILYKTMSDFPRNELFCNLFIWAVILVIFRELPRIMFFVALGAMAVGAWLCAKDEPLFKKKLGKKFN